MKASGLTGRVTVAGRTAAELADWTVEYGGGVATIRARAVSVNTYWLESAPAVTVTLDVGGRAWRWKRATATVTGEHITIRTEGKPEHA